jgi:SAM-dependent methyltransferase
VLDVGCGVGLTDQLLKVHLPLLAGVDISGKSLDVARVRNPEIAYHHSADDKLPFVNGSFDVVFAMCVWHHVPTSSISTRTRSDRTTSLHTKCFRIRSCAVTIGSGRTPREN